VHIRIRHQVARKRDCATQFARRAPCLGGEQSALRKRRHRHRQGGRAFRDDARRLSSTHERSARSKVRRRRVPPGLLVDRIESFDDTECISGRELLLDIPELRVCEWTAGGALALAHCVRYRRDPISRPSVVRRFGALAQGLEKVLARRSDVPFAMGRPSIASGECAQRGRQIGGVLE
jgi:hypothetical protein